MRVMIVVAILLGGVSASVGMPVVYLPVLSKAVHVHGCHQKYSHDMRGWHRHDKQCRTLQTVVGRKSRAQVKS
jgi:hypothetical protein